MGGRVGTLVLAAATIVGIVVSKRLSLFHPEPPSHVSISAWADEYVLPTAPAACSAARLGQVASRLLELRSDASRR